MVSLANSNKPLKKKLHYFYTNSFIKLNRRKFSPSSSHRLVITLIPKPHRVLQGNYRKGSLINPDIKILNKIQQINPNNI